MLNKKKRVQFIARTSKQGEKKIIIIPMQYHKDTQQFDGKQIKITMEDAIGD
ncbi:MAG: hypothetical protein L0H53_00545 [Candidatus Nitrosocosmicus sp.]|nr:hypothetical protein [Candidatus Nitrosocosmicus sp.]MDN5866025.1 hypothetical protein [Candidatus Nitrosocosmicus sp.]